MSFIYFLEYIDHKDHGARILGGMWGFRSELNRNLANSIYESITSRAIANIYNSRKSNPKGMDQSFLAAQVYDRVRHNAVIHDSHLCLHYADSTPWPTQRVGDCYVGLVLPCNTSNTFPFPCPIKCRPKKYSNWTTC